MRTKNAVSNIFIPLRELKKVFQDDALILVNKKFLEANGLSKKDKEEKLAFTTFFKGKYQLHSPENLRRIIDDLNLELHPEAYHSIDILSPNGKPKQSIVQTVKSGLPVWVYPVLGLVILVIFYIIMLFSISNKLDSVLNFLRTLIV